MIKVDSTVPGGVVVAEVDRIREPKSPRVGNIRLMLTRELPAYRYESGFSHVFFLSDSDCDRLIEMLQKARDSK